MWDSNPRPLFGLEYLSAVESKYVPWEVSSWCKAMNCGIKAMNCGIVVREFVLQSRYYVHFRANTLGKGMNPLILPPAMG